ncbi:MAG: exodeoxyribonuclease VII large subunit, partial [Candidatus Latescibacterota bacterium]
EANFPVVAVEGELSNYIHHASGHRYFTLKDDFSQLRCVMFKWQAERIDFKPEEGIKLLAVGNLTVYERSGQYQLNVFRLQPLGRGELLFQIEELKKKLSSEGLFEQKRQIPSYPFTVGVVTSPTGAAVRDIISVLKRRAPHVRIIIRPTLVQGTGASADIVQAVKELNLFSNADMIIIGRGGGSAEDLWSFNDEAVVRAVAGSRIPTISAVGHETDITLTDFAADLRAPTPSAAAELAVRDVTDVREVITGFQIHLKQKILSRLNDSAMRIDSLRKEFSPERFLQKIQFRSQMVDELSMRLKSGFALSISRFETDLEKLKSRLLAMNPRAVLLRGYSIVYRESDNRVIMKDSMVGKGDGIRVEFAEGRLNAVVK